MLSLCLWTPFAAGLLVLGLPDRRTSRRLAFVAACVPAAWLGLVLVSGPSSTASGWMPRLGASYELVVDGLSGGLALVVAAVALASLAAITPGAPGERRALAATLIAETAVLGVIAAADAFLLLSFTGAALASLAVLSGERRFAIVQWLGFAAAVAVVAFAYETASSQTGFPTASLDRFHGLVLFPGTQGAAFLAAVGGPLLMVIGMRPAAKTAPLFLAAYAIVPVLLVFRLAVSVFPDGASEHARFMQAVGVGLMAMAGLAPRVRLGWAFQGLILLGLFSRDADGVLASGFEWAHLACGLALWRLWGEASSRWAAALALGFVLVPPGAMLFARALAPATLLLVAALWIIIGIRLWRAPSRETAPAPVLARVPLIALCIALYLAPALYRSHLEPSLLSAPVDSFESRGEEEEEEEAEPEGDADAP